MGTYTKRFHDKDFQTVNLELQNMKVLLIFICIIQNVADVKGSPLENSGEKCWGKCNGQDGKCDWCGTKGWCCRKNKIANGCDGTFGGNGVHHECHLHSGMHVKSCSSSVSWLQGAS